MATVKSFVDELKLTHGLTEEVRLCLLTGATNWQDCYGYIIDDYEDDYDYDYDEVEGLITTLHTLDEVVEPHKAWADLPTELQTKIWAEKLGINSIAVSIVFQGAPNAPWEKPNIKHPMGVVSLLQKERYKWVLFLYDHGWTVDWLRKLSDCVIFPRRKKESLKRFVEAHPQQTLVRLLTLKKRGQVDTYNLITDTIHCWEWLRVNHPDVLEAKPRVRDLFQYHDWCYKQKVRLEPAYDLPINEEVKAIVGPTFGEYEVVFPKSSRDLKAWGHHHNHCVGSYGENVLQGHSIIFSLQKEGVSRYTVEVCPAEAGGYYLSQFYGDNNSSSPEDINAQMMALFQ